MDLEELKKLIDFLEKKDFAEVEYENQGVRLRLRRAEPSAQAAPAFSTQVQHKQSVDQLFQQTHQDPGEVLEEDKLLTINSPIVGTFYRAPSPEADPFVNEGDVVEKGQVLCIIEAMKIMNEIESEIRGRVKSILVENGQPVGYDDPLFAIDPL